MPKISVIVPVYKVEKYIHRCVDSILNQTFTDFELILVDDGSPDNCPQICDEYAKKDNRIIVIHKENGGLSDARNKGIDYAFEKSNSEWLTFIDSDDWVHKDYLNLLYNTNIKNNTKIACCLHLRTIEENLTDNIISNDNNNVKVYKPEDFFINEEKDFAIACGKLYKKELFKKYRYPLGKTHEDVFTTHKLIYECNIISFLPLIMYYYYQNPNSIMHTMDINTYKDSTEAVGKWLFFFKEKKSKKALLKTIMLYISYVRRLMREYDIEEKTKEIKYYRENKDVNEIFNNINILYFVIFHKISLSAIKNSIIIFLFKYKKYTLFLKWFC